MSAWNDFNDHNPRSAAHSAYWVRGCADFIRARGLSRPNMRALDYGCGVFDLGLAVQPFCRQVDGYDLHAGSIAIAKKRAQANGAKPAIITTSLDDLPRANYDLIIVNSVLQYLGSDQALAEFFSTCQRLLRGEGPGAVLVADLIPPKYMAWADAMLSIKLAWQHGFLLNMLQHLCRSALHGNTEQFSRWAPERFQELARTQGFRTETLAQNLTPSRQRYSCLLFNSQAG